MTWVKTVSELNRVADALVKDEAIYVLGLHPKPDEHVLEEL